MKSSKVVLLIHIFVSSMHHIETVWWNIIFSCKYLRFGLKYLNTQNIFVWKISGRAENLPSLLHFPSKRLLPCFVYSTQSLVNVMTITVMSPITLIHHKFDSQAVYPKSNFSSCLLAIKNIDYKDELWHNFYWYMIQKLCIIISISSNYFPWHCTNNILWVGRQISQPILVPCLISWDKTTVSIVFSEIGKSSK